MSDTVMWWVLAAILVALELSTGTFYLLLLAAGAVAGAVAAMFGLEFSVQLVFAAIIGGMGSFSHAGADSAQQAQAASPTCILIATRR
jgi:membrane protein implicated in regulation of membrane protease activity